jgi:hypothetical protein
LIAFTLVERMVLIAIWWPLLLMVFSLFNVSV